MAIEDPKYYMFKIIGENIEPKPAKSLENTGVFLIVDEKYQIIWIWSGKKSRLFHRYVAASWAGKLKFRKRFHTFKYRMIKEDQEPEEFIVNFKNLINSNGDMEDLMVQKEPVGALKQSEVDRVYRGDLTQTTSSDLKSSSLTYQRIAEKTNQSYYILSTDYLKMKNLYSDIKEMHQHIVYTLKHVEQKIFEIEEMMKKMEK